MPPPVSRVEAVLALRALAAKYGVDRVPDRAASYETRRNVCKSRSAGRGLAGRASLLLVVLIVVGVVWPEALRVPAVRLLRGSGAEFLRIAFHWT
jgi:hypothetical protein